jgi:hypothetical protein
LLIKAQQLDMVENIENRLSKFDWFDQVVKKKEVTRDQKTELFFNNGVYDDRCISVDSNITAFTGTHVSEPYEEAIRAISWGYRSLDKILPGQDAATDYKWYRNDSLKLHPALMTLVYKLGSENKNADMINYANSIEIKCAASSIFKYYRINTFISILVVIIFSLLFLIMFFRLIRTVTGRLFHTWDFKGEESIGSHKRNMVLKQLIKKEYDEYNGIEEVLKSKDDDPDRRYKALKELWEKEYAHNEYGKTNITFQENEILFNQYHLSALYESLWNLCSKEEKYFLYDMARDGFVNYKRAHLVQQLLYKGLLIKYYNEELKIMSVSFRNYILDKGRSEEVIKLKEEFHVQGTWSKLRTPVLIAITAIGTFLFITQQDIFQRVAALVPTISALLGLGTLILGSKTKQGSA